MGCDKIETKIIQINQPTGVWHYASRQLLRANDLPDTWHNQFKLVEWLKRHNDGKIDASGHIAMGKDITVPKDRYNTAKIAAYKLFDCRVAEVGIEELKDDDIISVDFHFVIDEYKKGHDKSDTRAVGWLDAYANYHNGITVQYDLAPDDANTMSIPAFSGGGEGADDSADAPITVGAYNVVSSRKEGFWGLIARDKNPNNDTVEKEGRYQSAIRLHHPGGGISWGCVTAGPEPVEGRYKTYNEMREAETIWMPVETLLNRVKENQERLGCVREQLVDYLRPFRRSVRTALTYMMNKNLGIMVNKSGRTKERVFGTLTVIAVTRNTNYKIEEMLR